jgi:hypothetical protein
MKHECKETHAFNESSRGKHSIGIQGTSHPGGLRDIAVLIAFKGLISETCKTVPYTVKFYVYYPLAKQWVYL